jgi:hypothetical protein
VCLVGGGYRTAHAQSINHCVIGKRQLAHVFVSSLSIIVVVKVERLKRFHGRKAAWYMIIVDFDFWTVFLAHDAIIRERQIFLQVKNLFVSHIVHGVGVRFVFEARRVEFGKKVVRVKGNVMRIIAPLWILVVQKELLGASVTQIGRTLS